jgi:CBS domain-containing protein
MKISDIMVKNVITVNRDAPISDVAKSLKQHKIHGLPVVDGKHLVGIVTETDFFIKGEVQIQMPSLLNFLTRVEVTKEKNESGLDEINGILKLKAEDIMTRECITLNPNDDVNELLSLIMKTDKHTIPITAGDILVGVVTVADVVELFYKERVELGIDKWGKL